MHDKNLAWPFLQQCERKSFQHCRTSSSSTAMTILRKIDSFPASSIANTANDTDVAQSPALYKILAAFSSRFALF